MKSRVTFFAAVSDSLCWLCIYWIAAATMILANRGWSTALIWPLLWSLLCAAADLLLLKKPRGFAFLMLLGVGMSAAGLVFLLLLSPARMTALYVFTLAVGAGMASGLPLYYLLHRPALSKHLNSLDFLLIAFVWLLLVQESHSFAFGTDLLIVLVLLADMAAAVGLRMTADGDVADAWKAVLAALASSVIVAAAAALLTALFSRSASLTGGFLGLMGSLFRWLGKLLESFFSWFSGLFYREPHYAELGDTEAFMPSLAGADGTIPVSRQSLTWLGVLLALAVLAVLAALLIVLRRQRWSLAGETKNALAASARTSRISGGWSRRWHAFLAALAFRWTTLLRRNSPPGLLICLQRRAKRRRQPRAEGETMRAFLTRMAPDGRLSALADDLDAHFYARQDYRLTAAQCRTIRKMIQTM